jgi:TDG/mug DNA glycosylase family protein
MLAAAGRTVRDVIAPGLRVLFCCGINPGLYSAATGHQFARPGNRFWPTLHPAGFTVRRLAPAEERELLAMGYGVTNIVARATATAAELSREELARGARRLAAKVRRYRPRVGATPRSAHKGSGSDRRWCGCCRTRAASTRTTNRDELARLYGQLRCRVAEGVL